MKKMNKKGFTLAELLIVVAIIAVLVAVAIPVFNAQLEKSRDATSVSNMRAAYAMAQAAYLSAAAEDDVTINTDPNGVITSIDVANVDIRSQSGNDWSGVDDALPFSAPTDNGAPGKKTMTFNYDGNGKITSVSMA